MPVLLTPRRGPSRDAPAWGQSLAAHLAQWQRTAGLPSLDAARARYRVANLQTLAEPRTPWSPRVPATVRDAQAGVAQADPQPIAPPARGGS